MRKCTKCNKKKPLDKYYKDKTAKNGRKARCIECVRKIARDNYRKKKKKRIKEKSKNKYIKQERKKHNDYYFLKPSNCYCDENFECTNCYIASKKILRYLKENEEGFWKETSLRGKILKDWIKKIDEGKKLRDLD